MRIILFCALLVFLGLAALLGRQPAADMPDAARSAAHASSQPPAAPRMARSGDSAAGPTDAAAAAASTPRDTFVDDKATGSRAEAARGRKAARQAVRAAEPAPPPRPVTPVWRDDPKAIASVIESPAFQDTATPVARLYFAYFGRTPDVEGFDYYVGQRERGRLLDTIADEFAGSRETEMRYGELDNAAFVERVFRNVLDDAGDAQQRSYWIAQLDSGAMTRGQVMLAFSESPAFQAATANEVFVSIAYAEIFGRSADPGELSRWVAFLDAGNSGEAVIQGLLASRGAPSGAR